MSSRAALTPLAIPSTLQDSLMARLDRLAPVKEIAQIGAAIGREFSYRLLEAVSPIQGPALQIALGQLIAAELIHARGAPLEATYVFKHALVQDTAHASLLRNRRQRIHAEIARALEERFADQVETAPAIIAHHYTDAGLPEPAARYWLKAAELALSRSAPTEAGHYIADGTALVPRLPNELARQSLELGFLIARANTLRSLKGFNNAETVGALTAAQRLLNSGVGTDSQCFFVLHGLCSAGHVGGQIELALALARQMVVVADRQDDPTHRLVAFRFLGTVQGMRGQQREALEYLEVAERYREPMRDKLLSHRLGIDPGLAVLYYKCITLIALGCFDRASGVSEQVLSQLPGHGHAPTIASGVFFAKVVPELLWGDFEACERHCVELIDYCGEKKVEQFRLFSTLVEACARGMRAPTQENIAAISASINEYRRSGARIFVSVYISQLAEA